ncbi:hypothetical protein GCK32_015669 [Trichostrongylus colubriformis]|uniref:Uncharacterized protein n=1 Tax=Trichostrongylus colubriformis TaxID=6319 RepID=A0AAN8IYQ1_TRICO
MQTVFITHCFHLMRITLLFLLLLVIVAEAGVLEKVNKMGKKAVAGVQKGVSKVKAKISKKKTAKGEVEAE